MNSLCEKLKYFLVMIAMMTSAALLSQDEDQVVPSELINQQSKSIKKLIQEQADSFFDQERNYAVFTGRVTDRDINTNILKISSENANIKFFRAGDLVRFKVVKAGRGFCEGYVRSVEDGYFVIYLKDIFPCFGSKKYFRRGTLLTFDSNRLEQRIGNASQYRVVLIKRKKDFFKQLNNVNHFLWSFDQQKVLTAIDYDRKILKLKKAKENALELLIHSKQDKIRLQKELVFRLDSIEKDLSFYRIDNTELYIDRWHLDHDLGLPVGRRPQKVKKKSY
jgi:hypothetical protein